jgi:hypothetical protein
MRSDTSFTEIGYVHFSSEGGDVDEAIKIGRFLRESLAMGWVDDHCYSACFLALVGSISIAGEHGTNDKVGIHRIFSDEATLKQTNIKDYESSYNELKKGVRQYCYDMDVPTFIVEKMFSISSHDIYYLTGEELSQLGAHPAYHEWINAKCPNRLSDQESLDYLNSFLFPERFSKGYIDYIKRKDTEYYKCENIVRWEQLRQTVPKYSRQIC